MSAELSLEKAVLKISAAIFCEDVRREDNGKLIIIGMYTQSLVVPAYPAAVNLGFFLHGKGSRQAQIPTKIRVILGPDELQVFGMSGNATVSDPSDFENFDFFFGAVSFQVHKDGYLSLQLMQNNNDWQELERLPIMKSDNSTPPSTSSAQPEKQSPFAGPVRAPQP